MCDPWSGKAEEFFYAYNSFTLFAEFLQYADGCPYVDIMFQSVTHKFYILKASSNFNIAFFFSVSAISMYGFIAE